MAHPNGATGTSQIANLGVLGTGLLDVVFSLLLICGALALHPGRILRILGVWFDELTGNGKEKTAMSVGFGWGMSVEKEAHR